MNIKQIFDEISAEGGSNMKMEILGKYKDNALLKRVLYMANSKRVKFYIKQIPEFSCPNLDILHSLEHALDMLDKLSTRYFTGSQASEWLQSILNSLSADDAYIICRIIEKDCKIGMGTSNINKIFPKLIEDTPYMGAKSYDVKLIKKLFEKGGRAFSQVKMDGRYCNAIIRGGEVEMESRGGEPTVLIGLSDPIFVRELSRLEDCVLNGELTIPGISRYESNGIIASLVSIGNKKKKDENVDKDILKLKEKHGYDYQEALDAIHFTIWDKITVDEYFEAKSDRPYNIRFDSLKTMLFNLIASNVKLVETKMVFTFEEAMAHFQEMLNRGEEGTILKSATGTWKDGKPNWQIKCKLEMDIDLIIVGFNYGTGKNVTVISSLNCETSDRLIKTRPTGINEEMMQHITENQENLLGTIIECKCSGLSHDSDGNYSLLHPVFKKLRDDKITCDTLESVKQIEKMAKGLA
jgi:DNA ligase-1